MKMEAFEDSHFMHHTVRGGHTESTGSIVSLIACIFDLKRIFMQPETHQNWTLSVG